MEFLDKIILPQSAEHIELLHYMMILVLSIFIPFISIIFGGTFLSVYYGSKFKKNNNTQYKIYSKDIIESVTVNNAVGVILGIVPLLTSIFIFAQLLDQSKINTVNYLILAFIFILIALIMIYTYRYSVTFNFIFNSVNDNDLNDSVVKEELNKIRISSSHLSIKYGKLGFAFLFFGMWFFVTGITSAELFTTWDISSIITAMFASAVLLKFITFICMAFTITAAAILFIHLYWDENKNDENPDYRNFLKNNASKLGLRFGIPLPILIAINLFSLSDKNLSGSIFIFSFLAILLLFLSYHFFFMLEVKNDYRFSSIIFITLILASISLIIKDQEAIGNATRQHSLVLSTEYDKILAKLKGEGSVTAVISGKEIYDVRCASCHRFDRKLVGPAYFDVLPQFVGKQAQLVAFIRNPVKVNPAFPPMPNPGLKPQEAEAVAKYLLDEFAKRNK
jgi:cytochrome c